MKIETGGGSTCLQMQPQSVTIDMFDEAQTYVLGLLEGPWKRFSVAEREELKNDGGDIAVTETEENTDIELEVWNLLESWSSRRVKQPPVQL